MNINNTTAMNHIRHHSKYYKIIIDSLKELSRDNVLCCDNTDYNIIIFILFENNNIKINTKQKTKNRWYSDNYNFTHREFINWVFQLGQIGKDTFLRRYLYTIIYTRISIKVLINKIITSFKNKFYNDNINNCSLNNLYMPQFFADVVSSLLITLNSTNCANSTNITIKLHKNSNDSEWRFFRTIYNGEISQYHEL
jgi:hypothetical protein